MDAAENQKNYECEVLRIHVEPIDVELEEDGSLLFIALQSALPGASGLYYETDCRKSVKFDGRKFLPPKDGWKDFKYNAVLGCRSSVSSLDSYISATKQFEKSVNSVCQLLSDSNALGQIPFNENFEMEGLKTDNMKQLLTLFTDNEFMNLKQEQECTNQTEELEVKKDSFSQQECVDPVSLIKNDAIEEDKKELKKFREVIEHKERELQSVNEKVNTLIQKCRMQDEELDILRGMNKNYLQIYERMNELTTKLLVYQETIDSLKNDMHALNTRFSKNEFEKSTAKIITMDSPQSVDKIKFSDSILQYDDIIDKAHEDIIPFRDFQMAKNITASMKEINPKLENEIITDNEKYKKLIKKYAEVIMENVELSKKSKQFDLIGNEMVNRYECPEEWIQEKEIMKKTLDDKDFKMSELSKVIQTLTKDVSESEKRAEKTAAANEELRKTLDHMETKIQEMNNNESESNRLKIALHDAKIRIDELTSLIAEFSADARNSRQDISDIL